MADLIWVSSGRDDDRVALFEQDPQHPDGEIFVAGGNPPVQAAKTAAVQRALAEGRLVEASAPSSAPKAPAVPKQDAGKSGNAGRPSGPEKE